MNPKGEGEKEIQEALSSPFRLKHTPRFSNCYWVQQCPMMEETKEGAGVHQVQTIFITILRHYLPFHFVDICTTLEYMAFNILCHTTGSMPIALLLPKHDAALRKSTWVVVEL